MDNKIARIATIGGLLVASIGLLVGGIGYLSNPIDNLQGWELPCMIISVAVGGIVITINDAIKSISPCQNRCGRKAEVKLTHFNMPPVAFGGEKNEHELCVPCSQKKLEEFARMSKHRETSIERFRDGSSIVITL